MKKILTCFFVAIIALCGFGLMACEDNENPPKVENINISFVVDGNVYETIQAKENETISLPNNPSKDGFSFDGWFWDNNVWERPFTANSLLGAQISANISVYAKFSVNVFTVTWKNYDGSILETDTVEYGATPSYNSSSPTQQANEQYTYTFKGWDKELSAVTDDITYTAQFDKTINKYTVTWKNYDGSILETDTVEYGATPSYDSSYPTISADTQNRYSFNGWDKVISPVKSNVTYTATFNNALYVYNPTDLTNIQLDNLIVLMDNIDLNDAEWTPLGNYNAAFTGIFDGNGYTISNFKITLYNYGYIGFFGYNNGIIQNLGVENFSINLSYSGFIWAGGLAGYNNSVIKNCFSVGEISATCSNSTDASYSGGLVGYNYNTITNCYADVNVTATIGNGMVGGLVGYNKNSISNCYATGSATATSNYSACDSYAGSLVGINFGSINSSFATGDATASSFQSSGVGGLVGYNSSTITNCYRYEGQVLKIRSNGNNSYSTTPSNNEGVEKTLEELQSISFLSTTLGWSTDDWIFTEHSNPTLK